MRLTRGRHSLKQLIRDFGFLDANECVNYKTGFLLLGKPPTSPLTNTTAAQHLFSVPGVPQRSSRSGICWYAATVFTLLFTPQMRKLVISRLEPSLAKLADRVLYDQEVAEAFRRGLYARYGFGDDPDQTPELDGKNGFNEMTFTLAQL